MDGRVSKSETKIRKLRIERRKSQSKVVCHRTRKAHSTSYQSRKGHSTKRGYNEHADLLTLRESRKVNSQTTCDTRRLDYWVADTLNGPGPSDMAWASKWAGPEENLGLYEWA